MVDVAKHYFAAAQQSSAISDQELKQAYCNSVQSLKDYIALSNLTSYDISGVQFSSDAAVILCCRLVSP